MAHRHNLPPQLTSVAGREREPAELDALVDGGRLLTLTGAGGAGKTRLAMETRCAGGRPIAIGAIAWGRCSLH